MDTHQFVISTRTIDRSSGRAVEHSAEPVTVSAGSAVTVGREGDIPLGVEPHDIGLSRVAATVTADSTGWVVDVSNGRGCQIHPWAQGQSWAPKGSRKTFAWPRVAMRVVGELADCEHWVLLSSTAFTPGDEGTLPQSSATLLPRRPRQLTDKELEAVRTVFNEHLAWPPYATPVTRSLEAAGARLGVHASAVRERLKPVADRARELGLYQPFGVTEPSYVFHLAMHGYLPFETERV